VWTGAGDNFGVEVATDAAFSNMVDAAVVSTNEHTVAVGALDNVTTYFWRVNASDINGTSEYSTVWSFTTVAATGPPDPPVLQLPADGALDVALEPTLEWAGTADSFDLEVATDAAFSNIVFSLTTAFDTATVPPGTLLEETTYHWHARGYNSFGAGTFAAAFSFMTLAPPDVDPPSQPQNLTSPAKTSNTVDLVWDASTDNVGVSFYNIYRDGVVVASESATNHTVVGLAPETAYDFQVSAVDAADNESVLSATLSVTTDPIPQPRIHVGDIALELRSQGRWNTGRAIITIVDEGGAPVDNATVTAQWSGLTADAESGVTSGGTVQFDSDKVDNAVSGEFIITVTDVSLSGFLYDPAANVETIDCVDTAGVSCSGVPDTDPPAAPASLNATAGPGSVSLDWPDNTEPDLAGYSIYRSTTSGSGHALVAEEVSASQYTDTGLSGGTTYFYVVTASDGSGNESTFSPEASATPTDPPQLSVRVTALSVTVLAQGKNFFGRATATVVDQDDNPIAGVEVQGTWTWNSTDLGARTGTTDGGGIATVDSSKEKASAGDTFTFVVTDLVLSGYTYDAAGSVTSASATVQ
jgi:chitodextrinase